MSELGVCSTKNTTIIALKYTKILSDSAQQQLSLFQSFFLSSRTEQENRNMIPSYLRYCLDYSEALVTLL